MELVQTEGVQRSKSMDSFRIFKILYGIFLCIEREIQSVTGKENRFP